MHPSYIESSSRCNRHQWQKRNLTSTVHTGPVISHNSTVVIIYHGHMNDRIFDSDSVCGGSSASLHHRPSGQHDELQVCVCVCVKVMCDVAPMSFHSSFHFRALYMLAERDEVWISFLPLPLSNLPQSVRTTCPGC